MGFACQVEKSRVSAVQDGAGASTRRVKPKEDDVRVRELEEKLRALDDKVGQNLAPSLLIFSLFRVIFIPVMTFGALPDP